MAHSMTSPCMGEAKFSMALPCPPPPPPPPPPIIYPTMMADSGATAFLGCLNVQLGVQAVQHTHSIMAKMVLYYKWGYYPVVMRHDGGGGFIQM